MESLYSIGLGLGLRVLIDAVTRQNPRIDGVLIGLWEGAVMNHFLWKFPTSVDPYIAFAFRLFIDFMVTADFTRLTVVVLWTGLGIVLSEVAPEVYRDKRFRRLTRPFRRWLAHPHLDFFPLPLDGSSRVRFRSVPSGASSTTPTSRTPVAPSPPDRTYLGRRHVPGSYQSETDTTVTIRTASTTRSSPAQIMPPTTQFSPIPRTRQVVSPGPSILSSSNRSVRHMASPEAAVRRVVISPPPSIAPSSAVSPPPPTQLPFSPPPADNDELEYVSSPPLQNPVASTSPPLIVPPPTLPSSNYPMPHPELRHQPSEPVLTPPLEDIPEVGLEVEDLSPEPEKKAYDELDALTTPPGMAKGAYISDDDDPLMTPPGMAMPIPNTDTSDRPPSYHFLPLGAVFENEHPPPNAQILDMKDPETPGSVQGFEGAIVPPVKQECTTVNEKTSVGEDLIKDGASARACPPVRGESVWGGSVKADQSIKGAPSIKGGQSVWGGSQKETASVRGDVPVKLAKGGSVWGSIWGGSSVKDDVSEVGGTSLKADPSVRSIPGDVSIRGSVRRDPSMRGAPTVLSDLLENPSVSGDPSCHSVPSVHRDPSVRSTRVSSIRGDPPVRATSIRGDPSTRGDLSVKGSVKRDFEDVANHAASNYSRADNRSTFSHPNMHDITPAGQIESGNPGGPKGLTDQERKEAEEADKAGLKLLERPASTIPPANIQTSPPHTQNVEGMKIEEALQATERAYKKAVEAGAPHLSIICGPGKNLRKRLVRMLEDQHGVSPSPSSNTRELVVPLPNIPPAAADDLNA